MNSRDVFINCPFSPDYRERFRALVYTVVRSGFTPRCARESDDAGQVRYDKICNIIKECAFGIHDISLTELDSRSRLPRFNMPFELGLFLGATKFAPPRYRNKTTLVLDRTEFRHQKFLSDIAGQDVHAYKGRTGRLIEEVSTWLRDYSGDPKVPGGRAIAREFRRLLADFPTIIATKELEDDEVTFRDFWTIAAEWVIAESGVK